MSTSTRRALGVDVRFVFFDLDDTLFDHRHARAGALQAVRREFPVLRKLSVAATLAIYDADLREAHPRVMAGALSLEEARRVRLRRFFSAAGGRPSPAELRAASRAWVAGYRQSSRPVAGALPLLRAFRGIRIGTGILSNNKLAEQRRKLDACGLSPYVNPIIVSEEVGVPKPDRRIFEAAIERVARDPPEVVLVGDSWESDVEGAIRAGWRAVWFDRGSNARPPTDARVPILRTLSPVRTAMRTILHAPGPAPTVASRA